MNPPSRRPPLPQLILVAGVALLGACVTDAPIVVAGRWSGTFFPVNFADRLLSLFAGPAIGSAYRLVQPTQYDNVNKGESFAIAGLGFLFSTAFWTAVGGSVSAVRRARLRRRQIQKSI